MTKVIIILGSPRRKGNSATLAENVVAGVKKAGATVDTYFLHGMDIKPCDACDSCKEDLKAECIIKDDMQELYPKLLQADALVIASPIYWFTVSAQTKLFMDRCYALGSSGEYALKGKRIGIVLTYKASDPFNSGAVNAIRTFQDAYKYIGAPIVGMVYGSASDPSEIVANHELMDQAFELGRRLAEGT